MSKKRRLKRTRHIDPRVEARGGLISAFDDLEDERRARINCVEPVVRAWKVHVGRHASEDLVITDILAELRYYCDCKGVDFDILAAAAYERYLDAAPTATIHF